MANDYKNRGSRGKPPAKKRRSSPQRKRRPAAKASLVDRARAAGWGKFLAGLIIGAVAVSTWLFTSNNNHTEAQTDCPVVDEKICPVVEERIAIPEVDEPRYDFYAMLEQIEVVVPDIEDELPASSRSNNNGNRPNRPTPASNAAYILQAGSFRNAKDAETRKAELALLGFEASIQSIALAADDTRHRVRVGPFSNSRKISLAQSKLLNNGIDVLLIRVTE